VTRFGTRSIRRFALATTLLVGVTLSSAAVPAAAATRPARTQAGKDAAALEARILTWMNALRDRNGARPLRDDTAVGAYARRHSDRMADRNRLFHSTEAQLDDILRGLGTRTHGENVGYASTLNQLKRAWMNSPSHRANILNARYDHAGVGVAITRQRIWATVVFYG